MKTVRRFLSRWLLILSIVFVVISGVQLLDAFAIPAEMRLLPGQEVGLELGRFLTVVDDSASGWLTPKEAGVMTVKAGDLGDARLQVRFFGLFPVRHLRVSVVPELSVIPGGQAIGVLISSHGLIVGDTLHVVDVDGNVRFPAQEADIEPGDVIARLAGQDVFSVEQVHELVNRFGRRGEALEAVIVRKGVRQTRIIVPVPVREHASMDISYRIGVTLENPAVGVGTLTFYDPLHLRFGGLGHMITDGFNNRVEVNDGRIIEAMIRGVQQGARGFPGEKIGSFQTDGNALGAIEKNTPFGIYGVLFHPPRHGHIVHPLPVALAHEVTPGDAQLLTVVDGQKVEAFQMRILQVHPNRRQDGRGLVIQITDERLLERTRGIVQGMSGSPILQDGKLVGAITHVFVNDPTRGYGILAEWMVYEAELSQNISDSGEDNATKQ